MGKTSWKTQIDAKLFNGHVIEPFPMVLIACAVGLAMLILSVWSSYDFLQTKEAPSLESVQEKIISYKKDGPSYYLLTDNATFILPCDSILNKQVLTEWTMSANAVTIIFKVDEDNKKSALNVYAIHDEKGFEIVSAMAIKNAEQESEIKAIFTLWIVCLSYWAFLLLSYYVVCNAPQYPKLASLLIRAPYRNF